MANGKQWGLSAAKDFERIVTTPLIFKEFLTGAATDVGNPKGAFACGVNAYSTSQVMIRIATDDASGVHYIILCK